MHSSSDYKRHQNMGQLQSGVPSQKWSSQYNAKWNQGAAGDQANPQQVQQRAAGMPSGATYTQNEKGNIVSQDCSLWKGGQMQVASDEKTPGVGSQGRHGNMIAKTSNQKNFRPFKAKQTTTGYAASSREGFMQVGSGVARSYNQYLNTPTTVTQSKFMQPAQRLAKDEMGGGAAITLSFGNSAASQLNQAELEGQTVPASGKAYKTTANTTGSTAAALMAPQQQTSSPGEQELVIPRDGFKFGRSSQDAQAP